MARATGRSAGQAVPVALGLLLAGVVLVGVYAYGAGLLIGLGPVDLVLTLATTTAVVALATWWLLRVARASRRRGPT